MLLVNKRDKIQWHTGMTIKDVLDIMKYEYALMTVCINGELVLKEDYEFFKIPDNADVNVFHLAHGG